jgi:hypothetical protein
MELTEVDNHPTSSALSTRLKCEGTHPTRMVGINLNGITSNNTLDNNQDCDLLISLLLD